MQTSMLGLASRETCVMLGQQTSYYYEIIKQKKKCKQITA